jgi:hypothetical protein
VLIRNVTRQLVAASFLFRGGGRGVSGRRVSPGPLRDPDLKPCTLSLFPIFTDGNVGDPEDLPGKKKAEPGVFIMFAPENFLFDIFRHSNAVILIDNREFSRIVCR